MGHVQFNEWLIGYITILAIFVVTKLADYFDQVWRVSKGKKERIEQVFTWGDLRVIPLYAFVVFIILWLVELAKFSNSLMQIQSISPMMKYINEEMQYMRKFFSKVWNILSLIGGFLFIVFIFVPIITIFWSRICENTHGDGWYPLI